jgi:hypothetical protein
MGEALDWIKTLNQGRHLSQSGGEKSDYRGRKKKKNVLDANERDD